MNILFAFSISLETGLVVSIRVAYLIGPPRTVINTYKSDINIAYRRKFKNYVFQRGDFITKLGRLENPGIFLDKPKVVNKISQIETDYKNSEIINVPTDLSSHSFLYWRK